MAPRKIPLRQCVGCQEQKPKRNLVRIVLMPTGEIVVDHSGKKAGRGTYLCPNTSCLELAKKRKSLDRGLKTHVPVQVYEQLHDEVEQGDNHE